MAESRNRKWCFTLNNWSKKELKNIKKITCEYMVIGKEVGENGTPHLQGYIVFKNARSLSGIKKEEGFERCHLEVTKGTVSQNYDYCTKDGDFIEIGEKPIEKPGKRNDLEDIRKIILEGGKMRDVISYGANLQGIKYAEKILSYVEQKRDWKPKVLWFYGESGTGKTRDAHKIADKACLKNNWCKWVSGINFKWFDGYDGHEVVIFDELRRDAFRFAHLLRILDRYETKVEYKGGSREFRPYMIIITCPLSPKDEFENEPEDIKQLIRRIDKIVAYPHKTVISE